MTLFFRNCKVLPMTAAAGEPNCFDGYVGVEGRRIALVPAAAAAAAGPPMTLAFLAVAIVA